jgi:hypothetical protein
MDALEFLRERKRMCNSYKDCDGCPLAKRRCIVIHVTPDEDIKRIVATVEKWSKEYPRKTRQSVFLEQRPEAEIDTYGCLMVCPKRISADCQISYGNCSNRVCSDCRREFWMQEVE